MTYRHVGTIGQPGDFAETIGGITVDAAGRLYAAGDSTIRVYGADGRRRWRTSKPACTVAVARDGKIFAGEAGQIEIFASDGRLLDTWVDSERLGRVSAIGFAGNDVLVGDARDRCIRRYDAGGKFLHNIGKDQRMQGFLIPNGIVDFDVDKSGVIHVTNPGKHRVERYAVEDKLLGHIGRFDGIDPAGFSGCCNPTNVTVAEDRIYCTEKADPRAKVYDFAGNLVAVIATDIFHPNCKNMDIAVDSLGRVYVTDTVARRILVFEGDA